jgi:hypothetical protein
MERFTQNWHLVRILQLAMGLLLVGSYFFYQQDGITLAFGLILMVQAFFNIGCLAGACLAPRQHHSADTPAIEETEVEYDEIV